MRIKLIPWLKKTCEENQGMYFKIDTPIKKQNFYNQKQSVPNTKAYGYVKNEFSPTKHAIGFTISIPNWKAKPIEGKEAQNFQLSENRA